MMHQPVDPRRLALLLQHERREEREEADDPAHNPMAEPTMTMLGTCSSSRSSRSRAARPASRARDRERGDDADDEDHAPKRNTHAALETLRIAAANGAATVPPRIAISASREFARTSSSGSSTTAGTSALLATE